MKGKIYGIAVILMIAISTPIIFTATAYASSWWDKLGEPQYGGTITIREQTINPTFDPLFFKPGDRIMWLESLFAWDWILDRDIWSFRSAYAPPEYNQGLLAESWEQPDGQTMIIHIRKGIYWQDKPPVNGRKFTANDVQQHYDRLLGTGSGYSKPSPTGLAFFSLIERVSATDDYTVTVKFKKPGFVPLMQITSDNISTLVEASESVKAEGGELIKDWKNAVGTGAWMLKDFQAGTSMTLTANPNYWGYDERHPKNKLPYADTLKLMVIPDVATALAALRTGKIDFMSRVNWQQAQSLADTHPDLRQAVLPMNSPAIQLRVDKAPFNDIKVRKALQMAIDRQAIAKSYYNGIVDGKPAGQNIVEGYGFAYEEWPEELKAEYSHNPARAKELLTEAGYPDGFKTNIVASVFNDLELLQVIKDEFKDIGVDMEIRTLDQASFSSYCQAGKHDQMVYYISNLTMPPNAVVAWLDSRTVPTNYTKNNDPAYDTINDRFNAARDADEAKRLATEADRYALEQHWVIPTVPAVNYNIYQPYLKGYSGEYLDWNAWFEYVRLWVDQDLKKSMGY